VAVVSLVDIKYLPLPFWVYVIIALIYAGILVYASSNIDSQFFLPVKFKGEAGKNQIAFSFDDGPHPELTAQIAGILNQHAITGTFFCIGRNIEKNPEIVRALDQAGHIIGNHSFYHSNRFDLQSADKMKMELQKTDQIIEETIGKKPRFFRPPYGVTNPNLARAVRSRNYISVGWTIRTFDSVVKDEKKILRKVIRKGKDGDIILFHDYCPFLPDILPEIINHFKKNGLDIVGIHTLIQEEPYA